MGHAVSSECSSAREWPKIESAIGITLPNDYKGYINTFGTGCIGGFLWVFNPFSQNENLNLLKQIQKQLDILSVLKNELGKECPYPLFPESGGLLPWGITDNGNVLFWRTIGSADDWNVVIGEGRGPEYEEFADTVTNFLRKLIVGDIESRIIPHDFLNRSVLFLSESD
jgi:hypothetical protein